MSGIFGLVRFKPTIDVRSSLSTMSRVLEHRGPNSEPIYPDSEIGLGHRSLRTAFDGCEVAADGLAITLDGRIDNRDELSEILALGALPPNDCSLVLACYRRWGEQCANHLIGDFAFAIWDPTSARLFCARDPFGVRPFYYFVSDQLFAFASEPQALLTIAPDLRKGLNEAWIGLFVGGFPPPATETLYLSIRRLAPAHFAVVIDSEVVLQRYYTLPRHTELSDAPSGQAARLAEILDAAVACRMVGRAPVAALLSGGLDSSSIVALAASRRQQAGQDPLDTFSMVYPDTPEHDERLFIDQVIAAAYASPHYLESGEVAPFLDFGKLLNSQGGPFLGPNLAASGRIHAFAGAAGAKIILDGHGGDETISYGGGRIPDLAFRWRWLTLWRELRALCAVEGLPFFRTYIRVLVRKGPHRRLRRRIGDWKRQILRRPPPTPEALRFVNAELAKRAALASLAPATLADPRHFGNEAQESHFDTVQSDFQSYAFELLDRAAAHAGIELRFPLWDQRVVEFCTSLPSHEKMRNGFTRSILRRAMSGKLPEPVRWRADKLDFVPHIARGMLDHHVPLIDELLVHKPGQIAQYVNLEVLQASWQRIRDRSRPPHGADVQAVWRAAALALWLRGENETLAGEPT